MGLGIGTSTVSCIPTLLLKTAAKPSELVSIKELLKAVVKILPVLASEVSTEKDTTREVVA